MVLTGTLMASCSYALALLLKQEDTLASVINTVATPLLLLSGITLPLTLAPKIIRSIASVNPLAYEVTASRVAVPRELRRPRDRRERRWCLAALPPWLSGGRSARSARAAAA